MYEKLAPQVGLEPTTLRLTAERLVAASRCKNNYLHARKADYRVNWGDSGGTLLSWHFESPAEPTWMADARLNRENLKPPVRQRAQGVRMNTWFRVSQSPCGVIRVQEMFLRV